MKICLTYAFVLTTLVWGSTVIGANESAPEILTCDSPSCESVAKKIEYQYEKPDKSITLNTGHFSIEIPDKPIRKIVASQGDIIILYRDDQLIYLSENRGPGIAGSSPEMAYQYPDIIFTKTPKDTLPKSTEEQLFWKAALASKPFYLQDATEISYSTNDNLTYYLSNTHELGLSARGMVTHSKYKNIFLVLEAKQMDLAPFKKVVYSVK
jgi:hypothetical protein